MCTPALSLFNNLVANAVEAFEEQGIIRIWINEKDVIVFSVADNGPGITPKYREKIFMPGYTTKFDKAGNPSTGIGLVYVNQETERLLGNVQVQDNTEGVGTVFTITLPIGQIGKEE